MSQEEREAKVVIWSSYPREVLLRIRLNSEEAGAFLGVSDRKMQDARTEAKLAKDSNLPVDANKESSIPYRDAGMIQYTAFHLLEFLDRTEFEVGGGRRMPEHLKGAGAKGAGKTSDDDWVRAEPGTVRRFLAWTETATSADTWPFSIQQDGRPLDLHTAMVENRLTGKAERLNLREFGDKLAAAADAARSDQVSRALHAETPLAKEPTVPRDRWEEPGGPI